MVLMVDETVFKVVVMAMVAVAVAVVLVAMRELSLR